MCLIKQTGLNISNKLPIIYHNNNNYCIEIINYETVDIFKDYFSFKSSGWTDVGKNKKLTN